MLLVCEQARGETLQSRCAAHDPHDSTEEGLRLHEGLVPRFFLFRTILSRKPELYPFVRTGIGCRNWFQFRNAKIRLAAADFKPAGVDPQTPSLKAEFDSTLYNDLSGAGIFDVVSKASHPRALPARRKR